MLRSITPIIVAGFLVSLTMGAKSEAENLSSASPPASEDQDPFEGVNRVSFDVSMFLDRNALRPVAKAYTDVIPQPLRNGARNVLDNLNSPVILVNNLLQGDGDAAGNTTTRFLVNSTIGVAGLMDPAADWGFVRDNEDFGTTLGRWGADPGAYVFIPLLGPSSLRDAVGRITDLAFDPLTYWKGSFWLPVGVAALDTVDSRARNLDNIDAIERTSIDTYAAVRSAYRQSRAAKINNGTSEVPDLSGN